MVTKIGDTVKPVVTPTSESPNTAANTVASTPTGQTAINAVAKPDRKASKLYQTAGGQGSLDVGADLDASARFAPPDYGKKHQKEYHQASKGPRTLVVSRWRRFW